VDKLWLLTQGSKTYDEYVQEFKRAARGSGYEGRALVEEFKRGLNGTIRRRLVSQTSFGRISTDNGSFSTI